MFCIVDVANAGSNFHRSGSRNKMRKVSESYHAAKFSNEPSPEPKSGRPDEESEEPEHHSPDKGYQVRM